MTDGPLDDADIEAMLRQVGAERFATLPALTAEELGELGLAIVDRMATMVEMVDHGHGAPGRLVALHSLRILQSLATAVAEAGYSVAGPGLDA